MKVTLQTAKLNKVSNFNADKTVFIPQKTVAADAFELPNFDSRGRSLVSFGGNKVNIDELELAKEKLINQRDAAQAKLDKADKWNEYEEEAKAKSNAEDEINKKYLSWYNFSKKSDIRNRWMNDFRQRSAEVKRIRENREVLQRVIDTCDSALQGKDGEISIGKMLNRAQDAQDAINKMMRGKGGLDDRIAGYGREKSDIERMIINPMINSKDNPNIKVPSAVMLYGATGTGKTTFLDAIAEQTGAKVEDWTDEYQLFKIEKDFKRKRTDARDRYLKKDENEKPKRTRTLLLINEAEKLLAMTPEYAKEHLDYALSDSDYALLEQYNSQTELIKNVNLLKGYLDHCSDAPDDSGIDDERKGALTIFITTNYPHLIHPDLLTRDGKLPYIAINPAEGSNIEEVIKHYTNLNAEVLEAAKNVNSDEGIDMLSGISDDAKTKLKEYLKQGKLDKLSINPDTIPYDKIALMCKPTDKLGAYSNDRYRKISEQAFRNYLENPETPYYTHFSKALIEEKRDIGPKRYAEFKRIHRILAPIEIGEREELIKLEKMGALDEKYKGRLDYMRMLEASDKENLLAKQQLGQITEAEKARLEEIEEYQRLDLLSFDEYFANDEEDDD